MEFAGHHLVSFVGFYLAVKYQAGLWFANFRLLSEFSTPLLNIRFFLQEFGMRDSRLYGINGMCIMVAFCLCRICTLPKFWLATYVNFSHLKKCPTSCIAILFVSGILLDTLNLIWLTKMINFVKHGELGAISKIVKGAIEQLRDKTMIKVNRVRRKIHNTIKRD